MFQSARGLGMRRGLATLLTMLCFIATQTLAVTFADKNFAQLVSEAEQVFVGTVSSLQSRKLSNGAIVTDAKFSELQVLKGSASNKEIVLLLLGGEVDGVRLEMTGGPQIQLSMRYVVFSKGNGTDMFPVVGGPSGLFQVVPPEIGGSSVVRDWEGKPLSESISMQIRDSASIQAQKDSRSTISIEDFIAAIRAQFAPK